MFFFLQGILFGYAQQTTAIEIRQSGSFNMDEAKYPGANILSRNEKTRVYLFHEGMDIYADRAIFYKQQNFFKAYGHVQIRQGDTLKLDSDYIEYDGNLKLAKSKINVRLENKQMVLTTDSLNYDRNLEQAFYSTPGTVKDSLTTIESLSGRFYSKQNKYRFKKQVKIIHPDYVVTSDQLDYYTDSDYAFFYGPTTIVGEDYDIFCKRGFYDTRNKRGFFVKDAEINYNFRLIEGDSLYFDNHLSYAAATNNIKLTDTLNNSIIRGHYAEVFKEKDSAIITKKALAINLVEKDSLYIHADTLIATGKPEDRIIRGYYDVRIFGKTLSGRADSVHVNKKTGLTQLLRKPLTKRQRQILTPSEIAAINPVLWSGGSQLLGDVVHLISDTITQELDSLKILNNAFVIEKDTLGKDNYNQVKGIFLNGKFENNRLKIIDIVKNTEMIYYLYEESSSEMIGIDKAICSALRMELNNNAIEVITFFTKPEGTIYPEADLPISERKLIGFQWRDADQINSVDDLFSPADKALKLIPIKGIVMPLDDEETLQMPSNGNPPSKKSTNTKPKPIAAPLPILKTSKTPSRNRLSKIPK